MSERNGITNAEQLSLFAVADTAEAEARSESEGFVEKHGLELLRPEEFEVRAEQAPLVELLLQHDENILVAAFTNSGKTVMFIVKAVQALSRGQRVVFVVTQDHLADQFRDEVIRFVKVDPSEVVAMTGHTPVIKRAENYRAEPRVLVLSVGALLNDLRTMRGPGANIGLFILDEIHHSRGDEPYTEVIELLHAFKAQLIGGSATPGYVKREMWWLFDKLKAHRLFVLPAKKGRLTEVVVRLGQSDAIRNAAAVIEREADRVLRSIATTMENRRLYDGSPTARFAPLVADIVGTERSGAARVLALFSAGKKRRRNAVKKPPPKSSIFSPEDRKRLQKLINERINDEEQYWTLVSLAGEYGLLCYWHENIVLRDPWIFVEDFAYRWTWHFMKPWVTLTEIEAKRRKRKAKADESDREAQAREKNRAFQRFFEKRALRNKNIQAVFRDIVGNSAYLRIFETASWSRLLKAAFPDIKASDAGSRGMARAFFREARNAAAVGNEIMPHPKLQAIRDILAQHPRHLNPDQVMIAVYTRRFAQYLQRWLQHEYSSFGYEGVWAHGAHGGTMANARDANMAAFRERRANVLVTTTYAFEGTHSPAVGVAIRHSGNNTNPALGKQWRGRIGRRREVDLEHEGQVKMKAGIFYDLVMRGTVDEANAAVERHRMRRMERDLGIVGTKIRTGKAQLPFDEAPTESV
ncbi:MAG: DEAD/DEAH box helicase [Deltaproteobacteria bacterium]|nr:DEAD/DEAH box helicase [Deltaproteobacteria bacterium]